MFINKKNFYVLFVYFGVLKLSNGFTLKAGKNYMLREFSTKDDQVKDIKVVPCTSIILSVMYVLYL